MIVKTEEESLLWQMLSMVALISELQSQDFLQSSYFKSMKFSNLTLKEIIANSTLGNPASMQMILYGLLILPQSVLKKKTINGLEKEFNKLNSVVGRLVEEVNTTYESDKKEVNYIRHIRNAVAHSLCRQSLVGDRSFVTFYDKNNKNKKEMCSIKMETHKVGAFCDILHQLLFDFLVRELIRNNKTVKIRLV